MLSQIVSFHNYGIGCNVLLQIRSPIIFWYVQHFKPLWNHLRCSTRFKRHSCCYYQIRYWSHRHCQNRSHPLWVLLSTLWAIWFAGTLRETGPFRLLYWKQPTTLWLSFVVPLRFSLFQRHVPPLRHQELVLAHARDTVLHEPGLLHPLRYGCS